MEEELIIVIDLDGTLISDGISQKIYREAYIETLKKMKERGIEIPDEFFSHSFENYCEISKRYEDFEKIYKSIYPIVLEKYIDDIGREEEKARVIYYHLIYRYKPKSVFILTANPKGDSIINKILSDIPRENIIVVDGTKYVDDKKKVLENLKSLGKVLYVADRDDIDRQAADKAGVDYININSIIEELKERELYNPKILIASRNKS